MPCVNQLLEKLTINEIKNNRDG